MAVRNFWIETHADGAKSTQATGPQAKDGGFKTTIYQRAVGEIVKAYEIQGRVLDNGTLRIGVFVNGEEINSLTTLR